MNYILLFLIIIMFYCYYVYNINSFNKLLYFNKKIENIIICLPIIKYILP